MKVLDEYLNRYFAELQLPTCDVRIEEHYNQVLADSQPAGVNLDRTNISPRGQTQIEPCDVISLHDGVARLTHTKISTSSSLLSHLFNQATNSVDLLSVEPAAVEKLKELIVRCDKTGAALAQLEPAIDQQDFEVVIAIITHKLGAEMTKNLPLFSRISLRRNLKAMQARKIPIKFAFIEDQYDRTSAKRDAEDG